MKFLKFFQLFSKKGLIYTFKRVIIYTESEVRQVIELVAKITDLTKEIVLLASAIIILIKSVKSKGE